MNYRELSKEDFDALVTGELTHYAVWMENVLVDLISKHFCTPARRSDFERLLLRRDGLTFQDKIEIVRAMLPLFDDLEAADRLKSLLGEVEAFKANRNAFAHGTDVTPDGCSAGRIDVETVSRSGKEKVVSVTPDSHGANMAGAERLLADLQMVRDELYA